MRAAVVVLAFLALAAPAAAEPVLELRGDHVVTTHQSFGPATDLPPPTVTVRDSKKRQAARLGEPTRESLQQLLASGQIDQPTHDARTATLDDALAAERSLTGTRKRELAAVIANADTIAAAGALTPSRLEPVFLTLARNAEWWRNGSLPANGQRVSFDGSELVWQYYRGQGIELQMLANFGKANALWAARRRSALRALIGELLPLASDRGGALAWEYLFRFGGGVPPWTSSISQGTAVQALGRAGALLEDPSLTDAARRALGVFEQPPPAGVRLDTGDGAHYLIYSFAPRLLVLNAHLQAVVGLHDFAQLSGDPRAAALFAAGDAEARAALPRYDTGKWSLYSLERESDLGYHELVTGFLENLCARTSQAVYCDTAARFHTYLSQPPEVGQNTRRIRTGRGARIGFGVDKIARVGMTIRDRRSGRVLFSTSAVVGRGNRSFTWRRPAKPGLYSLRLTARDLAGNDARPRNRRLRILPKRR